MGWDARTVSRRRLLGGVTAALVALTPLTGCSDVIEAVVESCPSEPAGIDWYPNIGHPVFWGYQEVATDEGPPHDLRIYYPTLDGSPNGAPIFKQCLVRWPVVLFLHGQPPVGVQVAGYHRVWDPIPAVLARSGYVVVVPNHFSDPTSADDAAKVVADVDWVRNQWSEREWVASSAEYTAVAGHSYGGILAATVAAAHPEYSAFASLSAPHGDLHSTAILESIDQPSFYMWAEGIGLGLAFEDLDSVWGGLAPRRYAAVFEGEHFDYLRASAAGSALRGPCEQVGIVTADLLALFVAANMPIPTSQSQVPIDLTSPDVELTDEQELFASGHLAGLGAFANDSGCNLYLRWDIDGTAGSRQLGSDSRS